MPLINVDNTAQPLFPQGSGQYLVANIDTANSVYISQQKTLSALDVPLLPQGSVVLDSSMQWYVATISQGVAVQVAVLQGATNYDNPVGVQISLNTLGLAKDSSVLALPGQIQSMGAPPFIPNVQSYGAQGLGPSGNPHTIVPMAPADTFIWYAYLSFAGSSNASHTGNDQMYAQLHTQSGKLLGAVEIALGDAASADSGSSTLAIGGLVFAQGDTIVLDVNNGNTVAETEFRASCVVMVGTP